MNTADISLSLLVHVNTEETSVPYVSLYSVMGEGGAHPVFHPSLLHRGTHEFFQRKLVKVTGVEQIADSLVVL